VIIVDFNRCQRKHNYFSLMIFRPRVSWFPWLVFCLLFTYSLERYIRFYPPSPEKNDQALLYAVIAIVLWSEHKAIAASWLGNGTGSVFFGSVLIISGCLGYAVGHPYESVTMDVWSLFLLAAGLLAALAPREYIRSAYFTAFAGTVVVMIGWVAPSILSSELALAIASACATVLNATLFPVVAKGVMLYFGRYCVIVTEGCSGMNSIFSLTALCIIYLRVGARRTIWHIALLVAFIIPVAVLSNLGRVILHVLAIQYVGVGFAEGLFHETAGFMAFVLALFQLAVIDRCLFFAYSSIKSPKLSTDADK